MAGYPRVTHPSATNLFKYLPKLLQRTSPFDLHVLSTPPAFILSQDQTLVIKFFPVQNNLSGYSFRSYCFRFVCFRFLPFGPLPHRPFSEILTNLQGCITV